MKCGNCGVELLAKWCFAPACQDYNKTMRWLAERRSTDEYYRRKAMARYHYQESGITE